MNTNAINPVTDSGDEVAAIDDSAAATSVLLQQELAAQKDDYLRLAADFDNFKKRTRRDSGQQAAAEKESFIGDLLRFWTISGQLLGKGAGFLELPEIVGRNEFGRLCDNLDPRTGGLPPQWSKTKHTEVMTACGVI
jgi:hypothetical protein